MNLKDKTVVINNKTYRYSKIVMLATNKAKIGNIYLKPKANIFNETAANNHNNKVYDCNPQHLYFLSTDKICEGDWFIANNGIHQCLEIVDGDYPYKVSNKYNNGEIQYQSKHWIGNKIIATTYPSLNLPKPSDSFLQVYIDAFNKNEKIEECLVEYIVNAEPAIDWEWKDTPKVTKGEITIRKVKDSWNKEEVIELFEKFIDAKYPILYPWISENL